MPPKKKPFKKMEDFKKEGYPPGIDPKWVAEEDARLRKELQRFFGKKKKK